MSQFLKWVGGKTQIMDKVTEKFPEKMNVYREPFVGGGSVLFEVLTNSKYSMKSIEVSDINKDLICCYDVIKYNVEELIIKLSDMVDKWRSIQQEKVDLPEGVTRINPSKHANYIDENEALGGSREGFYYYIRFKFNNRESSKIEMAAMFIFLNKIGWRGVCRYSGQSNIFNVPYGNPNINVGVYSEENLRECSRLFQRVNFRCCDFEVALEGVGKGDFVYLDPPYMNNDTEEGVQNFVGYVSNGFGKHEQLFNKLKGLNRGVKWIMSNAHNEKLRRVFPDCEIEVVEVRRAIHSKNPGTQTYEMLVLKI